MHPSLPIKRSLALILCCVAANSTALTLSELHTQSFIGQPFKASVNYRLAAGELSPEGCTTISAIEGDTPWIGPSRLQIRPQNDSSGVISIISNQAIGEPVVALRLNISCNSQQLSREYTVFLDPAPDIVAPSIASKSSNELSFPMPSKAPAGKSVTTQQETSLAAMAGRYYASDSRQYQRYLNRLKRANPDIASADTVIEAGSTVIVPPRPKAAAPKPTAPAVPAAPRVETGHLRIDAEEPQIVKANPELTPAQNSAAYTKALEEKIATLTALKKQLQIEIADLDQKMAQMKVPAAAAPAMIASVPVGVIAAAPASSSVQASTMQHQAAVVRASATDVAIIAPPVPRTQADSAMPWWSILLGLGVIVGGGLLWRRAVQLRQERWANEEINDGLDLNRSVMSIIQARVGRTMAQSPTVMSLFRGSTQGHHGIEVQEDTDNFLDQAQFFLAQGETLKAIDLLYAAIDEIPEDTERWLMLFRVFRQQLMKTEYASLAHRFRVINKDEGDWELIRSIGHKLDPENDLFIRKIDPALQNASPLAHFEHDMAEAAPEGLPMPVAKKIDITPDFTGAPLLPEFADNAIEETIVIEPASAELMDFLDTKPHEAEEVPLIPTPESVNQK